MAEPEEKVTSERTRQGSGRLLAVDLGARLVGVAVCDELQITVRPLPAIARRSWKDLLRRVEALVKSTGSEGLVIGLPLSLDGSEGPAAKEARSVAEKFRQSLQVPVFMQDERLTTFAAKKHLSSSARTQREIEREVDSEAAALILRDFIDSRRDGGVLI